MNQNKRYAIVRLIASVWLISVQIGGCSPTNAESKADKARIKSLESQVAVLEATLALKAGEASPGTPTPQAAVSPISEKPEPQAKADGDQWEYESVEEKMTGGTRKTASVESSNTVEFSFPYGGAQRGTLVLRSDPRHGKNVLFMISRGQILCPSYQGCSVQIRFDDDKPMRYSATGPSDGSSEVIFIENYAGFVGKLKKAKRVRLSVNIYQQGAPVFEFDVSGFSQERYVAKTS